MTGPNRQIAARQRGVSLVELMIAVVLALLLMTGVFSVYLSTKTTYRFQRGVSEIQENGRFANYFLTKEVRNAGYSGCPNLKSITPVMNVDFPAIGVTPAFTVKLDDAISGHELTGTTPVPAWTLGAPVTPNGDTVLADTDVFTVQFAAECGAVLTGNMAADNANIQVMAPNTCGFQANDILLISDCIAADVFAATNVSGGTISHSNAGNTTPRLSKVYGPNSELLQLQSTTYFLADSANGVRSLWRRLNHKALDANNPEMLVSGVESMQLQYGVDNDNDRTVDLYQTANDVGTDWGAVVTARIALLMRSADNVKPETDTSTYSLVGTTIDPVDDNRFRKVFVSTVSLRNRVP